MSRRRNMQEISHFILILSMLGIAIKARGGIIAVPRDYVTIQAAINAAVNGDTVLVSPGTYFENINFRGKNIVVASDYILTSDPSSIKNTIINGSAPRTRIPQVV